MWWHALYCEAYLLWYLLVCLWRFDSDRASVSFTDGPFWISVISSVRETARHGKALVCLKDSDVNPSPSWWLIQKHFFPTFSYWIWFNGTGFLYIKQISRPQSKKVFMWVPQIREINRWSPYDKIILKWKQQPGEHSKLWAQIPWKNSSQKIVFTMWGASKCVEIHERAKFHLALSPTHHPDTWPHIRCHCVAADHNYGVTYKKIIASLCIPFRTTHIGMLLKNMSMYHSC
jgi:hypothetical protein